VIVAAPSATEVTRAVVDTVAIAASDVAQDTGALLIVAPLWSLTEAVSWVVSPSASRLTLVGDIVIEVATGVGGVVVLSPHAASSSTVVSRM
jgi:hypothetical protein